MKPVLCKNCNKNKEICDSCRKFNLKWFAGFIRASTRRIIKNKNPHQKTLKLLGLKTKNELITYLQSLFKDGMNWQNYGSEMDKWNIDHIKPLKSFNLTIRKELKSAAHYTNLQPIWTTEHILKNVSERQD